MIGESLGCIWGWWGAASIEGWGPEMLLNFLQCRTAPKGSSAEAEKLSGAYYTQMNKRHAAIVAGPVLSLQKPVGRMGTIVHHNTKPSK